MIQNPVFQNWAPAIFCAVVVLINGWRLGSAFSALVWLPMCFFFVGHVTYSMSKKIRALQSEVSELRAQKGVARNPD